MRLSEHSNTLPLLTVLSPCDKWHCKTLVKWVAGAFKGKLRALNQSASSQVALFMTDLIEHCTCTTLFLVPWGDIASNIGTCWCCYISLCYWQSDGKGFSVSRTALLQSSGKLLAWQMHQWLLVDTAVAGFLLKVLLCQWLLVHSLLAACLASLLILQSLGTA